MLRIGFLRRQAESCLRLSQSCSDPLKARQLRLQASEFFRRASELEHEAREPPPRPEDRRC